MEIQGFVVPTWIQRLILISLRITGSLQPTIASVAVSSSSKDLNKKIHKTHTITVVAQLERVVSFSHYELDERDDQQFRPSSLRCK